MTDTTSSGPRWPLLAIGAALFALLGGVAGWAGQSQRGAPANKAEVEKIVREYILAHPEILPEAMDNLRSREQQKQIAGAGDQLEEPFPGAVLGNPNGRIALVEFSDYACGFCRKSVRDVEALIAANPEVKVVIRELPIISAGSPDAARMALAAAEQGKFEAFHRAMFARGRVDPGSIEAAAIKAGLDMDRARRALADPRVEEEIKRNMDFARKLGIDGTPSWVIGEDLMSGAVGFEELAKAVARAAS
jgi:protein-disulfide isomerase